ncbi:hypothetical protein J3459_016363 [Metarhizium acridum]|uniref:Uncharacterized protein n=1 Tax=Metarhizium acridum (strain CQMa 102) TaxID=655827 RepID=E9EBP5_METAQ|nr:uncharacterized protein MAC_07293 [Metarhizium acridum CQMa 102]EFY86695.1 hypothetical protein MAC_07293 [Metarhizium acridum CQMa 102]KAG8407067.1 hypothetical protein J3458_020561 [Metarhizium acridum]KAG8411324.1 hypothetical protein J3459_016363 [Metarhizium acridum]
MVRKTSQQRAATNAMVSCRADNHHQDGEMPCIANRPSLPIRSLKRKHSDDSTAGGSAQRDTDSASRCRLRPIDTTSAQTTDDYNFHWNMSASFESASAYKVQGVPQEHLHWVGPAFADDLSEYSSLSTPSPALAAYMPPSSRRFGEMTLPETGRLEDAFSQSAGTCLGRRQTSYGYDGGFAGMQDRKRMDRILGNLIQTEFRQREHAKQQLAAIHNSRCNVRDGGRW